MILSCPVCQTRYLVEEKAWGERTTRTVRCASCGHVWEQTAPPELQRHEDTTGAAGRIEPALEVPPRPGAGSAPTLEIPPRARPVLDPPERVGRNRWGALRWFVLAVLFALAILAGVLVARSAVVAIWPPAARLYALAGILVERPGAGLKIEKLAPARTPDGLIIEGDIINKGKASQDLPRLRIALRDAAEKDVQFKIIDPPQPRLAPGAVAHFKTPFDNPGEKATGVVVTFANH